MIERGSLEYKNWRVGKGKRKTRHKQINKCIIVFMFALK